MVMVEKGNKYVVYDKNGKVVIITSDKRIAEHYYERANPRQGSVPNE
jgi:hypothetical protein